MRAVAGPVLLQLAFVLAGAGLLRAAGTTAGGVGRRLALLGLAYVVGVGVVMAASVALLVVGVPFGLGTLAVVVALCSVPALRALPRLVGGRAWPARRPAAFHVVAAVVLSAVWIVLAVRAVDSPLVAWDAVTIWTYKARLFFETGTIPVELFRAPDRLPIPTVYPGELFPVAHFDYPLGMSLWQASLFRAIGAPDTSTVTVLTWALLPAWAGGVVTLAPRGTPTPVVAVTVIGLGLLLVPVVGTDVADIAVGVFLSLAVLALGRWLAARSRADLVTGVLLLGGAATFKNEGVVGGMIVLVVLLACLLGDRAGLRRAAVAAGAWAALFVVPWKLWLAFNDVHGDLPFSKLLDPAHVLGNLDRLGPIFAEVGTQLQDEPVALTALVAAAGLVLAAGSGRRVRAFARGVFAAYAAMLVAVYLITDHNLSWHLINSVPRVMLVLGMIGASCLLLVSERRSEPARDPEGAGREVSERGDEADPARPAAEEAVAA